MSFTVDVVIPVHNEENDLPRNVVILHDYLKKHLTNPWRIVIADNGSTDNTLPIAEMLTQKYSAVNFLHTPQKGRGRALKTAWLESDADIVSYMDIDLSTNLNHFPKLLQALEEGHDLAIGSRLSKGAKTKRSLKRTIISRSYNLIIRGLFFVGLSDTQCGFKALHRKVAHSLIKLVKNNNWFFDSELLIIAKKQHYRIKEMPVEWVEDPNSSVKIVRTAWEDIKGLLRLRFGGIPTPIGKNINKTDSN